MLNAQDKENISILMEVVMDRFRTAPTEFATLIDEKALKLYHIDAPFYKDYIFDVENPSVELFADRDKFKHTARIYKHQGNYYTENLVSNIALNKHSVADVISHLKDAYEFGVAVSLSPTTTFVYNNGGVISIRWSLFYPADFVEKEKLAEYYSGKVSEIFDYPIEVSL